MSDDNLIRQAREIGSFGGVQHLFINHSSADLASGMKYKTVYAWVRGVPVEEEAMNQLKNVAGMPFVYKHVAAMPDVHFGMGATVGSVIATKGAIIPAAVGVDIGCGMIAGRLNLTAKDLPDNLHGVRDEIEKAVPHGRTDNGGAGDRGAWGNLPENVASMFHETLWPGLRTIISNHPKIEPRRNPAHHLGTLGTGNHFIELCLDENQDVWVMLHSGSRGIGNKIGTYFIEKAKEEMRRWHIDAYLPDQDLSYLVENTALFDDYFTAVKWAQDFAFLNRTMMLDRVLDAIQKEIGQVVKLTETAVNCHHNYVDREHHFGQNVLVTRKGAVRAREGDLGIIPGSMGVKSFIVRGKGNEQSFCSCSHGAGRKMSRTQAKKIYSVEDHIAATQGVECRKDADVIDETPMAYKDIDAVMAAQSDLIEIVHTLKQVVCVKG
jgi:tRNA-splicing ligase RtcB (3'-phosphate/5'-hydroxy nucleic acid ligase)